MLILIICNTMIALGGVVYFLVFLTPMRPQTIGIGQSDEQFNFVLAFSMCLIGVIHLIPSIGFITKKRWSILFQKVLAITHIFLFPVGTVYALIALIGLNRPNVDSYFNQKVGFKSTN